MAVKPNERLRQPLAVRRRRSRFRKRLAANSGWLFVALTTITFWI